LNDKKTQALKQVDDEWGKEFGDKWLDDKSTYENIRLYKDTVASYERIKNSPTILKLKKDLAEQQANAMDTKIKEERAKMSKKIESQKEKVRAQQSETELNKLKTQISSTNSRWIKEEKQAEEKIVNGVKARLDATK